MTDDNAAVALGLLFAIVIGLAIYALPTFIAFYRGHHYRWIIAAINIVLGATAIGYLVALVWAVWPSETALCDPFRGDPVSPKGDTARRIHERHGEDRKALEAGEQWYYAIGKDIQGPIGRREVVALLVKGDLRQQDLVWKEGMQGWTKAGDIIPSP